jgi:hypothetical protein
MICREMGSQNSKAMVGTANTTVTAKLTSEAEKTYLSRLKSELLSRRLNWLTFYSGFGSWAPSYFRASLSSFDCPFVQIRLSNKKPTAITTANSIVAANAPIKPHRQDARISMAMAVTSQRSSAPNNQWLRHPGFGISDAPQLAASCCAGIGISF